MKVIGLTEAKAKLTACVEEARSGPVVITKNGKAVAVLIAPEDDDELERLLLAHSKRLKEILEARAARMARGEYLTHDQVWQHLDPK